VGQYAAMRIYGQHMEIFIAIEIFFIDDGVGTFPEKLGDIALGFVGQTPYRTGGCTALECLYADIHAGCLPVYACRFHEPQHGAVVGKSKETAFGVTEKILDCIFLWCHCESRWS